MSLLATLGAVAMLTLSPAQKAPEDTSPHSKASLVSAVKSIQPGSVFSVAIRIQMDPHWHCYWLNPGDSGSSVAYKWKLPPGFKVLNVHWPYPKTLEISQIISYGYEDEVLLIADIQAPKGLKAGATQKLSAAAEWLICSDTCLMATEAISLSLPVKSEAPKKDPDMAAKFKQSLSKVPRAAPTGWTFSAKRENDAYVLFVNYPSELTVNPNVYFFSRVAEVVAHSAKQAASQKGNNLTLRLKKSEYAEKPASRLEGAFVVRSQGEEKAYLISVPVVP